MTAENRGGAGADFQRLANRSQVAWLGLGSNIGLRGQALDRMLEWFAASGMALRTSPRLLTRAVGVTNQPDFLNQVVRMSSPQPLEPMGWLRLGKAAQEAAGRRFTYRWGPRRADADVLLLGADGELRVEVPDLVVPHPELESRAFLCGMLAELAPGLRHPDGWAFLERAGRFAPPLRSAE